MMTVVLELFLAVLPFPSHPEFIHQAKNPSQTDRHVLLPKTCELQSGPGQLWM